VKNKFPFGGKYCFEFGVLKRVLKSEKVKNLIGLAQHLRKVENILVKLKIQKIVLMFRGY
jgi:hypothetical protein